MRGIIKMINKEEEEKIFNEKLFDLIKVILKSKPKASIREVCNRIGMAKEGKLYTRHDIEECINMAIENGLLIVDENGEIEEEKSLDEKNRRKKFAEELKLKKDELTEKLKQENEANEGKNAKKVTGYFMRRNTPGKDR